MTLQEIARQHCGEIVESHGQVEPARVMEIFGTRRTASKQYSDGLWNLWTDSRIKGAFEFGKGTFADLCRYAKDNRKYATFVNLETGEVL